MRYKKYYLNQDLINNSNEKKSIIVGIGIKIKK
jgi:hypothetical protein